MKILRITALVALLMVAFALPAFAAEGTVTASIECYTEPESLTVTNDTDTDLEVTGITSSEDAQGDPEVNLSGTVAAGETETFEIGAESPGGGDNIFDNEVIEGSTVYTSLGELNPSCENPDTLELGEQPQPPPTGAGGMAGGGLPSGGLAAGVTMLLAGGYAALRRR